MPDLTKLLTRLAVMVALWAAIALLTAGSGVVAEQTRSGGLTVQVLDDGGPLPGAVVTISHPNQYVKKTSATTGPNGLVSFPVLRPSSDYVIDVEFPGYGTRRVSEVRVEAGVNKGLTVQLTPELNEKVTVTARANAVVLSHTSATTFSDEYLQELPVPGRFYQNVLTLAPGGQEVTGGTASAFREAYDEVTENPWEAVTQTPLSTFSVDVDSASYSNVRRFLSQGTLPSPGAVRIEEMVNYFTYDYESPAGAAPFAVDVEIAAAPWAPEHRLARIGIQAAKIEEGERPPANLVFLLDVSGSMQPADKLPLLKRAIKRFVSSLQADDTVSIVVYAGAAGRVLNPTPASRLPEILEAIRRLNAGSLTHGAAGIKLAYQTARDAFIEGGINRVVLATDGDFNVGISDRSRLIKMIGEEAKTGVFLTVLGFGTGNLQDSRMEQLADHGNGHYAYIDSIREAQRVLVEQAGSTLVTVAKDVKLQVEFNPAHVGAYRLIGYENRKLAAADFSDDTKDAGEIGAGHSVTALYELAPPHRVNQVMLGVEPLRYQSTIPSGASTEEVLIVKVRYKQPDGDVSVLDEFPVIDRGREFATMSDDFRFAASVAAFAMMLRGDKTARQLDLAEVTGWAAAAKGRDVGGYRAEFVELTSRAKSLLALVANDPR